MLTCSIRTGHKIIDFARSNLHVVGYSIPVNRKMSLSELQKHLYSLPAQPDAIPYVTSYYQERWGFCITHRQRELITEEGEYTVVIDSELKDGHLTYAELCIPGERADEILFRPMFAIPRWLTTSSPAQLSPLFWPSGCSRENRKYSYRIVFVPETIGSITYLSRNLKEMQRLVVAGYNVTCVGDERAYSYLPSRQEDSLSDRVALHVLRHLHSGICAL